MKHGTEEWTHYTDNAACPTKKRGFTTRSAAKAFNSRMVRLGRDRCAVYRCTECIYYHLGHLPKRVKTGQDGRGDIIRPTPATRERFGESQRERRRGRSST